MFSDEWVCYHYFLSAGRRPHAKMPGFEIYTAAFFCSYQNIIYYVEIVRKI